jgi:hypothetical protein
MLPDAHPVEEAFSARREAVRTAGRPERRAALDNIVFTRPLCAFRSSSGRRNADRWPASTATQGVALVARRGAIASVDDIMALAKARGQRPFVLILDFARRPQNLGTLLRSAEATGIHGVIYPERARYPRPRPTDKTRWQRGRRSKPKAAAGATAHCLLAPGADLRASTIGDLRGARAASAHRRPIRTERWPDCARPTCAGPSSRLVVRERGSYGISGQLRQSPA